MDSTKLIATILNIHAAKNENERVTAIMRDLRTYTFDEQTLVLHVVDTIERNFPNESINNKSK